MKSSLLVILSMLLLASCNRAVDSSSHVVIQLPGNNNAAAKTASFVAGLLSHAGGVNIFSEASGAADWAPIAPTGYQDKYNLNCFFVLVSAPDLNNYTCHKVSTSTVPTQSVNDDDNIVLRYGISAGAATIGSALELSVDAGKDRVFTIYGMHSDSTIACSDFDNGLFNRGAMSKPYYLGKSKPTQLDSGAESSVTIQMENYDPEKYIDYCDSDDSLKGAPVGATVGAMEAKIDTGVFGGNADYTFCIPIDVGYKDTTGLQGILNTYTGNVTMNSIKPGPVTAALASYESEYDCLKNQNAQSSFSFPNLYQSRRYVKGLDIYGLQNISVNEAPTQIPEFKLFAPITNITSGAQLVPAASFPEVVRNGVCYPILLNNNKSDWTGFTGFSLAALSVSPTFTPSAGRGVNFYSNVDCSTTIGTNSLNQANVTGYSAKYFMKFSGLASGDKIKYTYSSSAPTYLGNYYSVAEGDAGNASPVKFKIQGPNEFAWISKCVGPFRVSAVDKIGAEVDGEKHVVQLTISDDQISVYGSETGAPCSTAPILTSAMPGVFTLTSGQFFYVKLNNTAGYSNTQYLFITDTSASGKLIPSNIQLNLTDSSLNADVDRTSPSPTPPTFCYSCALP